MMTNTTNTTRTTNDRAHRPRPAELRQVALPFDDEAEAPIPFVLTAAAHREVLGRDLPTLSVVPVLPEPVDTRRVQARALLRSGMPVATIAAALGSDIEEVGRWTEDLVDELARRRRHRSARHPVAPAVGVGGTPVPMEDGQRRKLLPGLAFALAKTDGDGVTIRHDQVEPVAVLIDGLRDRLPGLSDRLRVALRVGARTPSDRARSEVAARLEVDASRVIVGRVDGGAAPTLEIRVEIRDADAARLVRAWHEDPDEGGAELRGWDSNPQTFRLTADCSAS
jgi:hypothetical protein